MPNNYVLLLGPEPKYRKLKSTYKKKKNPQKETEESNELGYYLREKSISSTLIEDRTSNGHEFALLNFLRKRDSLFECGKSTIITTTACCNHFTLNLGTTLNPASGNEDSCKG